MRFAGAWFRLRNPEQLDEGPELGAGSFVESADGHWYFCVTVKKPVPAARRRPDPDTPPWVYFWVGTAWPMPPTGGDWTPMRGGGTGANAYCSGSLTPGRRSTDGQAPACAPACSDCTGACSTGAATRCTSFRIGWSETPPPSS